MDVPVQFFQTIVAVELAITGGLLYQIRFFDHRRDEADDEAAAAPWFRLVMAAVLLVTLFGSLYAIRHDGGRTAAVLVTIGLAISVLPILLRVFPPLGRRHPHAAVTVVGLTGYVVAVAAVVVLLDS